jgi:metal-sulfur cluster biosynthetic enzyme
MPEGRPTPAEDAVWDALRTVDDPEVGTNVVDLGLVYGVEVHGQDVTVRLTMTSPTCPLGDVIVDNASAAIRAAAPGVGKIDIALVWDPPWTPERMSEAARKRFGW